MNCPQCGELCRCQSEPLPPSLLPSSGAADVTAAPIAAPEVDSEAEVSDDTEDAEAWRGELSARLNRYRARRKVRPPRYPSLSLRFDAFESGANSSSVSLPQSTFEPVSNHALALDSIRREPSPVADDGCSVAAFATQRRAARRIFQFRPLQRWIYLHRVSNRKDH